MSAYVTWFVIGFALLVAELLTGTFYLLVLAIAAGVAGVAALAGASLPLQLVVAAAIGLAGSLWLRRARAGKLPPAADAMQNLDVGQPVRIDHWSASRTARTTYRGAQWDVELAAGEEPLPGDYVIREIHGSRLIVAGRR
ncbi:MAG: NfeD family protein [Burkholderiaceae bacterium]|jgi:membrane protein implicated in regulation of membrane protease activity|nr:NfeD family protein [Burkholderiaceae bacterium]